MWFFGIIKYLFLFFFIIIISCSLNFFFLFSSFDERKKKCEKDDKTETYKLSLTEIKRNGRKKIMKIEQRWTSIILKFIQKSRKYHKIWRLIVKMGVNLNSVVNQFQNWIVFLTFLYFFFPLHFLLLIITVSSELQ